MSILQMLLPNGAGALAAMRGRGALRAWLYGVALLVFLMVLVGGATRVTQSGLSITRWQPISGILPPLSEAAWQEEFANYKQIPQYTELNADMNLAGFKNIFYWEWAHRLLARLIGIAFILPALWFRRSGQLRGDFGRAVWAAAGFLALEPIVGWWMVVSGLRERVEVAQERLALHLMIASAVLGAVVWAASLIRVSKPEAVSRRLAWLALAMPVAIFVQLGLGALVAGLRAGLVYNTWPLMDGAWVPKGSFALTPWWANFFDDIGAVQFDHRVMAYGVVALALALAISAQRAAPGTALARRCAAIAGLGVAQAGLGVATLLLVAPVGLALAHQAFAMLLFGVSVYNAGVAFSSCDVSPASASPQRNLRAVA